MSNRYKLFFILSACILLLTGCQPISTSWKTLAKAAIAYYGPATLVEHSEEKQTTVVTLKDDTYGFTYTVRSETPKDGTWTSSDYESLYLQYAIETEAESLNRLKETYFTDINWILPINPSGALATVSLKRDTFINFYRELISVLKPYNERDFYHNAYIEFVYENRFLGSYYFGCDELIAPDDLTVTWYRNALFMELAYNQKLPIENEQELVLTGKEYLSEEELHEQAVFAAVYRITDTPEALQHIPVFHFSWNGTGYVIANIIDAKGPTLLIYTRP